jgi:hypothetical protein
VRRTCVCLLWLICAFLQADERPACWLVVGNTGRAAAIQRHGALALKASGFDVASESSGKAPRVVIVFPRALGSSSEVSVIHQMVKEGAGLVVVYSLTPDLRPVTDQLMSPWKVALQPASVTSGKTDVVAHQITEGLGKLFVWRVPASIVGVEPLLRQDTNIVAGVSTKGGRRLVVLPLDAIVPGQSEDAIPQPHLQLLTQAAQWAARSEVVEKPPVSGPSSKGQEGGGVSSESPIDRGEYRRTAYLDMGAEDENWPEIRKTMADILGAASLKVHEIRVLPAPRRREESRKSAEPQSLPLVAALKDSPAILVIGSCREFQDTEAVAVAAYVRAGGALLVLPRATFQSNMRMVHINAILTEFGMAASLGREDGVPELIPSFLTENLGNVGKLTAGILIVGHRGVDVVTCTGSPIVRVDETGGGRMAVADPLPLLATYVDADTRKSWEKLIGRLVGWLVQGMSFKED